MNRVVPWAELVAVIEPVYPKADGPGRPPVGIERMLRLDCLQQGFNLSDPAVEEARYDSRAMRQFLWGLIWVASRYPTRRRAVSFGIGWRPISWASSSLRGSVPIWRLTA